MNAPIPPKCLSIETIDVTGSMIRLDHPSFGRAAVRMVLSTHAVGMSAFAKGYEVYHLDMSGIHLASPDSHHFDGVVADDVLLRQEPDEEEDDEEEEDDGKDDGDDDDGDDGYSE